jgi:hypothetical protein
MRLVLLEIVIVAIATRSVLQLLGHAPAWPSPLMEFFGFLLIGATAALLLSEVRARVARPRRSEQSPVPPHIPLERIGPFTQEQLLVRYGPSGEREIHLN